jgi:hypothetical protein
MTAGALTKISGPTSHAGIKKAVFTYLFSTGYASGGEVVDFSSYFRLLYAIVLHGSDAYADLVWNFQPILPAPTTTITASNVKFLIRGKSGSLATECDTADMHGVGKLAVSAYGI